MAPMCFVVIFIVITVPLLYPVLLAALNCDPKEGSARLAGAVVRETLAKGGRACRPLFAPKGLGPALVDPAVAFIRKNGGEAWHLIAADEGHGFAKKANSDYAFLAQLEFWKRYLLGE